MLLPETSKRSGVGDGLQMCHQAEMRALHGDDIPAVDGLLEVREEPLELRVVANLRGELYPEIAAVWGLAFAIFLEWEGARLQPEEIRLGVIVTIVGVFLTRIVAIVRGAKGWSYA